MALQGFTESGHLHALRALIANVTRLLHTVNMQMHLSV
jgi:hypothetical protein